MSENIINTLFKIYNSIYKDIKDLEYFSIDNSLKLETYDDICNLFPLYVHGYNGVRDAINKLNESYNNIDFIVIYSYSKSSFYLLYKNKKKFIDIFNAKNK